MQVYLYTLATNSFYGGVSYSTTLLYNINAITPIVVLPLTKIECQKKMKKVQYNVF